MNDYSISVVIPNYNNEKFVQSCIESIAKQTYPIEKIIVVDDCSSDRSVEILQKLTYTHSNLQIIPLKTNGKVSHARNTGLHAVTTPYVTFIDSDDLYVNENKIKNEMQLIRFHKETYGKDIAAYSAIRLLTYDGTPIPSLCYKERHYLEGDVFSRVLTEKYHFTIMRDYCLPTAYVKAIGGYDESNSLYEDLD